MWFDEAVLYQIYPLGLCGAPEYNDGVTVPRIRSLLPGRSISGSWGRTPSS